MTSLKKSIVREDGSLVGGLTALPLGLWLLAGVVLGWIEPAPVERWGSPLFVLLPFLLLGEFVVYRLYERWSGAPKGAFRDARGIAIIMGGLALIYGATIGFDLGQGLAMAAMAAWLGVLLLTFGHPSRVHVLVGCALVVAGLVLLLPVSVNRDDVVLILFGFGSIACGLAEHDAYMEQQAPRTERAR